MVHDTRIIPLDGRPALGAGIRQYMGDSRARFEGNTLVVESANFTDKTALGGVRHSEQLKLTERFTRIDPQMIDYEIRVEDPLTWEQPWTLRMTITQQPDYEIYEYACHEGNMAMRHMLIGGARIRACGGRSRGQRLAAARARVRARERAGSSSLT